MAVVFREPDTVVNKRGYGVQAYKNTKNIMDLGLILQLNTQEITN